jgi:arsenite-transporting ATPase
VGKTTCASAFAVASAKTHRVLLVSTDPAHSLGDALGVKLSSAPRGVRPRLDAVELDAPRAFARWLDANRTALRDILEQGTWLDRDDIDALLGLSMPGVDELAGILEIGRLTEASLPRRSSRSRRASAGGRSNYQMVVVDTAPTGHTLRLLTAPTTVAAVADVLDALREEHRVIRDQLARVGRRADAADQLITLLAQQARDTTDRLRNRRQTTFHWVTLPEDLAREESADGIAALERGRLAVTELIVNRVLPAGSPCRVCDRRRASERRVIAEIRRTLARKRRLRLVPAQVKEPRGLVALAALAQHSEDSRRSSFDRLRMSETARGRMSETARHRTLVVSLSNHEQANHVDLVSGASLLFVGGKGGVGKTTVAAAAALRLARTDSTRRVLLLSTDPAHSLGDVFQTTVGDTTKTIGGGPSNFDVRELDAAHAFAERRAQFETALDDISSSSGLPGSASSGAQELMDLAPPGIDELFGMLSVVDARAAYDVVIVDTAPTGHALRLLEMPEAAREWTQVLLRVLLKYKSLVRPGRLAADLVDVSKSIRELQSLLRDPTHTRFILVTRAAEVPRRESARLLHRLRRLRLAVPALVVNALTLAPGRCAWCRATAAAERRELAALRRVCGRRCAIIQTPLAAPPPRGVEALDEWARTFIV